MPRYEDMDGTEVLFCTIVPRGALADIGAVAVYYSNLDNVLHHLLWCLLDVGEDRGLILTQSMSFASRVELLRALAIQKHPGHKRRVSNIAVQLRLAGDDRNRLMHDHLAGVTADADTLEWKSISTFRHNAVSGQSHEYHFDGDTLVDLQWRLLRLYEVLADLREGSEDWVTAPLPSIAKSPTELLRKKNEERQREAQRERRKGG